MPDRRAFGIRISRRRLARQPVWNPAAAVRGARGTGDGAGRMVVSGTSGDWDTAALAMSRSARRGPGQRGSQGYRDLSLTEARERRLFETQGDDCGERTVGKDKIRHTLRFEGKGYVIPRRGPWTAPSSGSGQPRLLGGGRVRAAASRTRCSQASAASPGARRLHTISMENGPGSTSAGSGSVSRRPRGGGAPAWRSGRARTACGSATM